MAAFNFDGATLKLVFETGVDEFGKPKLTSKTYRNIRPNIQPDQLANVVQAIASLTSHPLNDVKKIETQSVEL